MLATIIRTWGSAARSVGVIMLIRDDGMVVESVSGARIEDDLIERVESGRLGLVTPKMTSFAAEVFASRGARRGTGTPPVPESS